MKKNFTLIILAVCFFCCAIESKAQWNLTGNANATASSFLGTTNAIPLNLTTNNVQRMVIDANGKIGIGTSTPINILTVKGTGSTPAPTWVAAGAPLFVGFGENAVGNADYILAMASTSNNGRPVFVGRRSRGTLAVPTAMANNDFIMSMLASGFDGAAFQNAATIDFFVDGTPSAGNVPARISFVTGSNSNNRAERLKIGNTGDITFNTNQLFLQKSTGFLGIGTTTPNAQLQLGNTVVNRKLVLFDIANNDNQFYGFGINNGTLRYQVDAISASHVFYAGNGIVASKELMRIQGNGNVGIGTTAPLALLDVKADVLINGLMVGRGNNNDTTNTAFGKSALINNNSVNNTAVGSFALSTNTIGSDNTATGGGALRSNTGGYYNTANGGDALFSNTDGADNTANGARALYSNTNGSSNTANGTITMFKNTTGSFNTANGFGALYSNSTGNSNIANGYQALFSNTTGSSNVANGYQALVSNTTGSFNTANGINALSYNATGSFNIANGVDALYSQTDGINNTAIGASALYSNATGSGNTGIGYLADVNTGGLTNASAIGANATVTASNSIQLGSTSVISIKGGNNVTIVSDARFKKEIHENVPGLAFINQLRPVTYTFDIHKLNQYIAPKGTPKPGEIEEAAIKAKEQIHYTGFLAQEVEQAAQKIQYDFSGLYKPQNSKDPYGLSYAAFVVPLVKAVQELSNSRYAR